MSRNSECREKRGTGLYRLLVSLSPCLLVCLLSASPPPPDARPEVFVRLGNEAFARGDYGEAEALYGRAEERGTDPGLIAFNKATALYHLGQFREAERHYRRALGDAAISPERRARGLYNLGDCLLRQAGESDVGMLRSAVACFERCLDAEPADAGLRTDAAYNLELAKVLWNKARAKSPKPPNPEDEPKDHAPPSPKQEPGAEPKDPEGQGGKSEPKKAEPAGPAPPDAKAEQTDQKAPGAGNLPVILDSPDPQPLSPEDAREYLRKAAQRLHRERRSLLEAIAEERSHARD